MPLLKGGKWLRGGGKEIFGNAVTGVLRQTLRGRILEIRTFRRRGLKILFQQGDASKVRADQVGRIVDVLGHLDGAQRPSDLDLPGYRLHPLKGDLNDGDAFDVDLVDYH